VFRFPHVFASRSLILARGQELSFRTRKGFRKEKAPLLTSRAAIRIAVKLTAHGLVEPWKPTLRDIMSYLRDADAWLDKLLEGLPEANLIAAKKEIKAKILESYHNGQNACPNCRKDKKQWTGKPSRTAS
jgi:hypothetical protein